MNKVIYHFECAVCKAMEKRSYTFYDLPPKPEPPLGWVKVAHLWVCRKHVVSVDGAPFPPR